MHQCLYWSWLLTLLLYPGHWLLSVFSKYIHLGLAFQSLHPTSDLGLSAVSLSGFH